MSSDRQRLVGAIRRIAGIDTQDGERASASSNRGSQPGSVGRGITESDDRLCCDGSVSDSINPGVSTSDPGSGGGDGLNSSDPADLDGIGSGELTGVTDCETGEPVCFSGNCIPPDDWGACNDPPIDPEFVEGEYWFASVQPQGGSITTTYHQTCSSARQWVQSQISCACWPFIANCEFGQSGNFVCGETLCFQGAVEITSRDCSESPNSICDEPPPLADSWPDDGCVNLSIINGAIVGSKFDPENDGSYNAPRDEIELCDGSNGSILIRGSAGGGWKSIASLSGDIDPDTDHGYLYSAYGDVIRQISPSEFRDDRV